MGDAVSDLTPKQQLFVAHYCEVWNATEAAALAGYTGNRKTLSVTGAENLGNPRIAAAIQQRIAAIMPAGEVLSRLADHARATMADFIDPVNETLDLAKAERANKLHLLKKFSRTDGEKSTHVSIELHDAQAALVQLGKHHGLFRDRVEHSGEVGTYVVDLGLADDSSAG